MDNLNKIIKSYKSFRPFTNDEAWILFKIAAICEAIGWTLLISGILIAKYLTPGNNIPILLAGNVHGTLFLIYLAAVAVLSPSMKWNGWRMIIAGICSVPPYGSLLFELWASHDRKTKQFKNLRGLLYYLKHLSI